MFIGIDSPCIKIDNNRYLLDGYCSSQQLYSDYQDEIQSLHQQLISIENTHLKALTTALWDFNEPLVKQQLQGIISVDGVTFVEPTTVFGKVYSAGTNITISIGYTVVKSNETFKSALNRSDKHLYTAKSNGRNCFVTDKAFVPNIVS